MCSHLENCYVLCLFIYNLIMGVVIEKHTL